MRYIVSLLAFFIPVASFTQQISLSILPEAIKRNQLDISSVISYQNGLLSAVMESDGNDERYIIKLGLINQDKTIQKSIDIGFKSEQKMKLIGIYKVDGRPLILYTTQEGKLNDRHVKAVLINPQTLKMEGVKEIITIPGELKNGTQIKENNIDAEWLGILDVEASQDSGKYFIDEQKNNEHHFVVFDGAAKVLFDRKEKFPEGSRNFSVCLTHKDKLIIYYNLADVPGNAVYKHDYKTIIRSVDLNTNKSTETQIDKSFGNIRQIKMLFKTNLSDELHLLGLYSESFSDDDFAGAVHFTFDTQTEKATFIAKKEMPYDIKLSSLFPDYFSGKGPQIENYPLFERMIFPHCDWRNNDIDLAVEYFAWGFPLLNFQSIINFHFSGADIIVTTIEKKQLGPEENAFIYCGTTTIVFNNKLIFIFNDNSENLSGDKRPKDFNPLEKKPGSLVAVIVDEKGRTTKQEIYGKFEKNNYAELLISQFGDGNTIVARISKPDTRNKEFKLGFITIN